VVYALLLRMTFWPLRN